MSERVWPWQGEKREDRRFIVRLYHPGSVTYSGVGGLISRTEPMWELYDRDERKGCELGTYREMHKRERQLRFNRRSEASRTGWMHP
jgi:hypothetical protein